MRAVASGEIKGTGATTARRAGEKYVPWMLLAPTMIIMTLVGFFPLVHSLYISMTSYRPTEIDKPQGFVGIVRHKYPRGMECREQLRQLVQHTGVRRSIQSIKRLIE